MMLMSKSINGGEAYALGLVDAIVSPDELVKTARSWALDIVESRRPWIKSLYRTDKLEPLEMAREILNFARDQAQKQAAKLQHPLICIDVIEEGIVSGPLAGLWKELDSSRMLQSSETSKSLVHVFFAQRATSKVPCITDIGLKPRGILKVAIVGGGLMGSGIATALILSNYLVILKEVNENFLQSGIGRVRGTQRLPRLVGLSKALEMMLMSKSINGGEAYALGLVDAIVSPDELVKTARSWALDIVESRRPWIKSLYRTDKLEPLEMAREILNFARDQAQKQAAKLQHPLICIDVIEEGIVSGPLAGLWKELDSSRMLQSSETSKSLVHVFFAQRATSKVPCITDIGLKPRGILKVAIVGGGLMGSGIATALILSNYLVILKEVNENFLQSGIGRVRANLQGHVKKGKMTQEECGKALSLLIGVLDYKHFKDVDMVIEAVIENVSLKQQIFADLEKYCPPYCILASNTSTIDLNSIGEKTMSQDRIVGAHFFSPAHVMPLLEIVRTQKTSAQTVVDLLGVARKIHKTPIVVGNCTGFAVNRMFFPYSQAAALLVDHGLDVYQIDRAIIKFGMPMGPFRLADLVGFEVAVATGTQYLQSFPERCYRSMLIPIMLEDKRTGESSRKGFYVYDGNRKASPDPDIKKYIEKSRSISGVTQGPKVMELADKDIIEMVFFPVVNEACRVLDEGIASKASDLDIASTMGMGFPSYRGTFRRVVKKKSTESFKWQPYVTTLLSTSLWTFYGLLKPGGLLVVTVNGTGSVLQAIYVTLYLIYAPRDTRVKMAKLVAILNVGFLGLVMVVTLLAIHGSLRLTVIGSMCAALTVGMYASPLAAMRMVVKTKSVEYMPFFLSFFLFLNGGVWSGYSVLVQDYFIGVPNGIGFALGSIQLVLYAIYKRKTPSAKAAAADEKEGSTHLVEMQGCEGIHAAQQRHLSKGSSLPKPSIPRQTSLNKAVRSLSMTACELHSYWHQNERLGS
ncbi:hypothetical protein COCNU_scaffold015884G000010 [Cocos nucifera]|nr:hypothetical protein [Cocos nucifera]